MMMNDGYWWVPGHARSDRSYTLQEAMAAVGPGWRPLADEGWRLVTDAGGWIVQEKKKVDSLRIYYRVPSDEDQVRERIDALEAKSFFICEWCGGPGRAGECAACASDVHDLPEAHELREWISLQPHTNRPAWFRPLMLEPGSADWELIAGSARRVERCP
jgi:hypothetical protein